jgi:hypothetical protein
MNETVLVMTLMTISGVLGATFGAFVTLAFSRKSVI